MMTKKLLALSLSALVGVGSLSGSFVASASKTDHTEAVQHTNGTHLGSEPVKLKGVNLGLEPVKDASQSEADPDVVQVDLGFEPEEKSDTLTIDPDNSDVIYPADPEAEKAGLGYEPLHPEKPAMEDPDITSDEINLGYEPLDEDTDMIDPDNKEIDLGYEPEDNDIIEVSSLDFESGNNIIVDDEDLGFEPEEKDMMDDVDPDNSDIEYPADPEAEKAGLGYEPLHP